MTRRVVLATRNAGKVAELRRILEAAGLDVLRCEEVERTTGDGGAAIDVVLVARGR